MTEPSPIADDAAAPESPYKGLAPFEDSALDAFFFFGREREREIVTSNLIASRLTVLYGASGVGKSSLLRAGVAHSLRVGGGSNGGVPGTRVVVFDDWSAPDPVRALVRALGDDLGETSLADALGRLSERAGGDVYVILDQIEEYFLYHGDHGAEGTLSLALPEAVSQAGLRANLLVAVREDALAHLDVFKPRLPNLFGNYLRLEHLGRDAARSAILKPIEHFNLLVPAGEEVGIEPQLPDAVLREVGAGAVGLGAGGLGGVERTEDADRVEAPFLQLVMQRLWDAERTQESRVLRLETLQTLGGAAAIVRGHLDSALADLLEPQKDAAAAMFHHLVTPTGTKIAHGIGDLARYADAPESEAKRVLDQLAGQRVLRADERAGEQRYEIFHDILADPILVWRTRHTAARAAEQRVRRALRLGTALFAALVVVGAIAVYALVQRGEARDQARAAEARAFAAGARAQLDDDPELSLLLALEAARRERAPDIEDVLRRALERSRIRGILSASEAPPELADDPMSDEDRTVAARASGRVVMLRSKHRARSTRAIRHEARVRTLDIGPGERLATAAAGDAFLWNVRTGRLRNRLEGHRGTILDVAFSPDGTRIATASADGTARLWDGGTGELVATLFGHANHVSRLAFNRDGTVLATASLDGTARLWEAAGGRPLGTLAGHRGIVTGVAFAKRRDEVFTRTADGKVRRWDALIEPRLVVANVSPTPASTAATASTGRRGVVEGSVAHLSGGDAPARSLRGHSDDITSLQFSADGRLVVTAGRDADARIWNAVTGRPMRLLKGHFGPVVAASFSPDARWVVTAGPISAGLWEVASGRLVFFLRGHTAPLTAASFGRDGKTIVTADRDGVTRRYRCEICGGLDELIGIARRRLAATGRQLTPAERARYAP